MLYNYISPETTVKTAALVAAGASSIINRTNNLINYGNVTSFEYMNEETGTLNKKGLEDLNDLYKNIKKFRDEIINFVGDKAGLSSERVLDKRFNNNTLNKLGKEILAWFACSIDCTIALIDILVSFKLEL